MQMNNNTKLNEDYVVDVELLRFEKLVEERQAYEEQFFSLEPSIDEFEHIILQYTHELQNQNYECPDFEDCLNQLRDEQLIEERLIYEQNHLSIALDDFALNDFYDYQIEAREEEGFFEPDDYDLEYEPEDYSDYEYDQYDEELFWELEYLKRSQFEPPKCNCAYMDYMPHDDGFCDYIDCYDYPEGPDENLWGVKFY